MSKCFVMGHNSNKQNCLEALYKHDRMLLSKDVGDETVTCELLPVA